MGRFRVFHRSGYCDKNEKGQSFPASWVKCESIDRERRKKQDERWMRAGDVGEGATRFSGWTRASRIQMRAPGLTRGGDPLVFFFHGGP